MFKRKRKIIKDINFLPLKSWVMINKTNDLGYLYAEYQKENKKDNLNKVVEDIQYQIYDIMGVDLSLIKAWNRVLDQYLKYNTIYLKNKVRKIEKMKPIKNPTHYYNKAFNLYLELMQKHYKDFQVYQYSLIPDFEQKYKEFYEIEVSELINDVLPKTAFFSLNHFFGKLRDLPDTEINFKIKSVLITDVFISKFITKDIIVIQDLDEYHLELENDYRSNAQFIQFFRDKKNIFDFKMSRKPKHENNLTSLIAKIELNQKIIINQNEKSVAEFYEIVKQIGKDVK